MSIHQPQQPQSRRHTPALTPRPLWPTDIPRLRMDLHPRLDTEEAIEILNERPGASFWLPESDEFILVHPWRHRAELSSIHTFGAFANEDVLMKAVLEHARQSGQAGMVVVDVNETRHPTFFARHGIERLEDIVTYAHPDPGSHHARSHAGHLEFLRVPAGPSTLLTAVIDLDHRAFPWFWWNSAHEFDAYLNYPGVEVWAGIASDRVVAYAGITRYRGWAHLDRIATSPDLQGQGIGQATLGHMMGRAAQKGARSLALSTQRNNRQSRRLYERAGFEPTPRDDYSIHVASFNDDLVKAGFTPASSNDAIIRP